VSDETPQHQQASEIWPRGPRWRADARRKKLSGNAAQTVLGDGWSAAEQVFESPPSGAKPSESKRVTAERAQGV
jgi:hypothetical protein